ncbi:hypothetical protein JTE90_014469 [Oedothorax gibbosus]|uniref:Uncharacterized protein n=1 Tax=Oedothorax gibbosus TaxID=931172 RepID=A0AAV6VL38_9ARAC|nr:hypothetical protein JTE90_014469 [Oedothorax gibbosus]
MSKLQTCLCPKFFFAESYSKRTKALGERPKEDSSPLKSQARLETSFVSRDPYFGVLGLPHQIYRQGFNKEPPPRSVRDIEEVNVPCYLDLFCGWAYGTKFPRYPRWDHEYI